MPTVVGSAFEKDIQIIRVSVKLDPKVYICIFNANDLSEPSKCLTRDGEKIDVHNIPQNILDVAKTKAQEIATRFAKDIRLYKK